MDVIWNTAHSSHADTNHCTALWEFLAKSIIPSIMYVHVLLYGAWQPSLGSAQVISVALRLYYSSMTSSYKIEYNVVLLTSEGFCLCVYWEKASHLCVLPPTQGTMSLAEWEVIGLYLVYVFQKRDPSTSTMWLQWHFTVIPDSIHSPHLFYSVIDILSCFN